MQKSGAAAKMIPIGKTEHESPMASHVEQILLEIGEDPTGRPPQDSGAGGESTADLTRATAPTLPACSTARCSRWNTTTW